MKPRARVHIVCDNKRSENGMFFHVIKHNIILLVRQIDRYLRGFERCNPSSASLKNFSDEKKLFPFLYLCS